MKKTLKILALVLALVMVIGVFAACQKPEAAPEAPAAEEAAPEAPAAEEEAPAEEAPAAEETPAEEAPADEAKSIVFCHKSLDYFAYVAMEQAMKKGAEDLGWKFQSTVAEQDAATQTNHVINAISQGADAIVVDPVDSDGIVDALEQAQEAGIVAAVIDTPTNSGNFPTIVFDNYEAGKLAGERTVELLTKKYGEPKGVCVYPYGATSSSAWEARRHGYEDVLAQYPNIEYVGIPAEGDMQLSHDAIMNAAAKYEIDAVHAPSDNPGLGIVEALKQLDMWHKVGEEGHVIFITIDGEPCAQEFIAEGYYDATVAQDCSAYGTLLIKILNDYYFKGEEMPLGEFTDETYFWKTAQVVDDVYGRGMILPAYLIDATNNDDPAHWGNYATNVLGLTY